MEIKRWNIDNEILAKFDKDRKRRENQKKMQKI